MTTPDDLCQRFFEAATAGDGEAIAAVCAPGFEGSQNGGPTMGRDALVGFSLAVVGAVENFRYENAVRSTTDDTFVEEHDVCADLPDGTAFRLRVCVVGTVADGQITSLREYLDTARAAPLLQALSA